MPIIPGGEFRRSKKQYAVKPDGLQVRSTHRFTNAKDREGELFHYHNYSVPAVWFRKRSNGAMAAFVGNIGDAHGGYGDEHKLPPFADVNGFMAAYDNARYGGNPLGCVDEDGGRWWAKSYADDYSKQEAVLPLLNSMLSRFGEVPDGYDGWFILTEPARG